MEIQRVTRHLNVEMLEEAYREGIFPMADIELGIVTWHRPRRRAVLPLDAFHISRSLERTLRQGKFEVTFDQDFAAVMAACSERKPTWISAEFQRVYAELHALGKAHSVEVNFRSEVTFDQDFAAVMAACSERKPTWISAEFQRVYAELHALGKAHSVEVNF